MFIIVSVMQRLWQPVWNMDTWKRKKWKERRMADGNSQSGREMKGDAYLQELLGQMTLEEKTAQMVQLSGDYFEGSGITTGPNGRMALPETVLRNTGSTLNVAGRETLKEVQKHYLENSRLKIPMLFMADIINGFRTVFPIPLGQSCSFNPELVKEGAKIAAREGAAEGLHVTFSPMSDLCRDARWGRVMESFGEDVYLNCQMTRAMVEGYQQEGIENPGTLASCAKHFAGYGAPEGGREYNSVDLSEKKLKEEYLPAYQAAVDAGCELMMTSFNTLNGIPSSANVWLNQEILRKEWGFDGVLISDYGALKELEVHGAAEGEREAAELAVKASVDMDMVSSVYGGNLANLVNDGVIEEAFLDQAVLRILRLKDRLGLFENPYRYDEETAKAEEREIFNSNHRETARKLAEESMVLLTNRGVLPISEDAHIALIGPFADSKKIYGSWSLFAQEDQVVSLCEGMESICGKEHIAYAMGSCFLDSETEFMTFRNQLISGKTERKELGKTDEELLKEAEMAAEKAEVIVLALGEHPQQSGEGAARAAIGLPRCQLNLLHRLWAMGKPIAVILFSGRPLEVQKVVEEADALLLGWFPGSEGGSAAANLLTGRVNPSGRLAMSFPYCVGQEPLSYVHFRTGRPSQGEKQRFQIGYQDVPDHPLFSFGYGLSYTSFQYENLMADDSQFTENGILKISGKVKNVGNCDGTETVLCYIQDVCGSTARPVKELKAFQRVHLKAGECKEFSFEIKEQNLRFVTADGAFRTELGKYRIFAGGMETEVVRT